MNLINTNALTMSSQEIAELVGSRHDKVKQSIERLAARGAIQLPPLGGVRNHLGQTVEQYQVCKRDSFVVVAQLSPEFTAALVDRWQELEEKAARPMTQAEITAANANHLVAMERQHREQQVALERIERRVEDLSQTTVWDHCPQNCQSLTRIKGNDAGAPWAFRGCRRLRVEGLAKPAQPGRHGPQWSRRRPRLAVSRLVKRATSQRRSIALSPNPRWSAPARQPTHISRAGFAWSRRFSHETEIHQKRTQGPDRRAVD